MSENDIAFLFAEVGSALGRDPHGEGDLWMALSETERW